jgi:membrane peptidoglycan carboxypeptidase
MIKRRKIKIVLIVSLLLLFISCGVLLVFYYQVTRDTAKRIQKGAIQAVIASESPVYYDDGKTPIGVFFEMTHRQYVPYAEIPKTFVKAIVAAEDQHFFEHGGFEIKGILRALFANLRAGKVVQGGSTLTQQTAKNIFKRQKRSYKAKLKELIQAFLLERRYSKQEILEMYANQFFVTGFGKGLQVASQYFFDKDAKDLDLVESAFIAGLVKSPNRYNPFIKKSGAERQETLRLAERRKNYVLANMFRLHFIGKKEFLKAKASKIPFKEGQITYKLNVMLDYVRDELESGYFKKVLSDQGIENIATSGIRIYTSINRNMQEAALRSLRETLPLLDVQLAGYNPKEQGLEYAQLKQMGLLGDPEEGFPFMVRVAHIDPMNAQAYLRVDWKGGESKIDYQGLKPLGEAWLKGKLGQWALFSKDHVSSFLKLFKQGDMIPVQWTSGPENPQERRMRLTVFPDLEGGIVALHQGLIKAMVGGFSNRYFNRADAKRQLGSIFKPIVYAAALQLKWNPLDPLMNTYDLFPFEKTYYAPRPDHQPKSKIVSMAWAGAKSENLATVWLLYHLTDRLKMSEFRQVVNLLGLGRGKNESYLEYKNRIRDKNGVVVNRETLIEAAFEKAKKDAEPDIIFGGNERILGMLRRLHYRIPKEAEEKLGAEKDQILRYDFTRLGRLNLRMKKSVEQLSDAFQNISGVTPADKKSYLLRHFYRVVGDEQKKGRIVYSENPKAIPETVLEPLLPGELENMDFSKQMQDIWIDGLAPSTLIDQLQEYMKDNYRDFLQRNRYDLEVLYWVRDFRTLTNLSYVVYLGREMGIYTHLDPVLSFPLGANAISILEAANAFQTIMTGKVYPISGEDVQEPFVAVITKIVDRDGETIWSYEPKPRRVLSEKVSSSITEILRKVMEIGTGQKAGSAVHVRSMSLPSYGKTGTANRFTNSSFVGFIPGIDISSGTLSLDNGYVVASYVGYDNNRPMKGEHFAVYGSSGALPLWVDTVNAIANDEHFKGSFDMEKEILLNAVADSTKCPRGLFAVPVSELTGLPGQFTNVASGDASFNLFCTPADFSGSSLELLREFDPSEKKK